MRSMMVFAAALFLVAWSSLPAPAAGSAADGVNCADSATAAYRLEHVLPIFADTTAESVEWRTDGGLQQTAWTDAEAVRDPDLCARIDARARAWHARAPDVSVFGSYTVHALRIGPYYAAVVDYPYENSTGWSLLLVLAGDDLRVLDYGLV